METVRRRQLIEATIDTIHEVGFANASLQSIARRAGVSPGLVAHYFRDKEGLLEATLRQLAADLGRGAARRLAQAATPYDRLLAVVDANLEPAQFDRRIATVWLAFWGQVLHSPRLRRVQMVYEKRLASNLRHAFRQIVPRPDAARLAEATAALIDGLWLRATLSVEPSDPDEARATMRRFLRDNLPPEALQGAPPARRPSRSR
jgi:transcriptional repressor BetI